MTINDFFDIGITVLLIAGSWLLIVYAAYFVFMSFMDPRGAPVLIRALYGVYVIAVFFLLFLVSPYKHFITFSTPGFWFALILFAVLTIAMFVLAGAASGGKGGK